MRCQRRRKLLSDQQTLLVNTREVCYSQGYACCCSSNRLHLPLGNTYVSTVAYNGPACINQVRETPSSGGGSKSCWRKLAMQEIVTFGCYLLEKDMKGIASAFRDVFKGPNAQHGYQTNIFLHDERTAEAFEPLVAPKVEDYIISTSRTGRTCLKLHERRMTNRTSRPRRMHQTSAVY